MTASVVWGGEAVLVLELLWNLWVKEVEWIGAFTHCPHITIEWLVLPWQINLLQEGGV